MSERATWPVRRPRLNPFAFPSDTTLRFVLLATFVVCGSGLIYGELRGPTDRAVTECVSRLSSELSKLDMSSPANADRNAAAIWQDVIPLQAQCAKLMRPSVVWQIGGMCLAIGVAAFLYALFPIFILRNGRLEPISASEFPELTDELKRIVEASGLSDPPTFVWNPLATGLPLAFGRRGRYYVALSGSFVTQYFYADKDSFRVVMLHELAHVKNGDIHKTYLTISLLLSFMTVSIFPTIPVSLWLAINHSWLQSMHLLAIGLLWTIVVILSGLSVLRVREYYADIQASVWDQTPRIDRVLAALPAHRGEGWRRYLRFHPDSMERRQIVEDPSRLFGLSFADAFGIGIATWSVIDVASAVLLPFLPLGAGWAGLILSWSHKFIISAVVFVFAVGAIGIGVWRSAFASLLTGEHPSKGTGWLGAALVAGSLPGFIISAAEAAVERSLPTSAFLTTVQGQVATYLVLLVSCQLIFRWIAGAASAWFEVVLRSWSPRPILLLSVATALVLVVGSLASASFLVIFSFSAMPWREWGPSWIYAYGLAAGGPILLASFAVWGFPLAAPFWREARPTSMAGWVFLDGATPDLPDREPLRSRGALLTGVTMGLLFWLLWELVYFRIYFPSGIGDGIYSAFSLLSAWIVWLFGDQGFILPGLAAGFQALAAAIAAGRARRLSVVHGLFAASVAGCVIVAGDWIFFGIRFDVPVSALTLASLQIMGLGAAVALPTAITAAWIGSVARRALPLVSRRPASNSSGSSGGLAAMSHHRRETQTSLTERRLISIGFAAALCLVVGIGMAARVREQVAAMNEVSASRASAERGDSDAQNRLAAIYAGGQSVAQDDVQAVFWWSKSAEQGHADAQYDLAQMYFVGRGVAKDESVAFELVRKAAEQGHADAENVLGSMYAVGQGVPQDDAEALRWFQRASDQGNAAAQNNLGIFYASGRGAPRDDAAAVDSFRKAAERGHADAQTNLGFMYQQGRALPKDDVLALQWFQRAADQGHAEAQFRVGQMYEGSEAVPKDDNQAIFWLRKAAEQNHFQADSQLRAMCDRGLVAACVP